MTGGRAADPRAHMTGGGAVDPTLESRRRRRRVHADPPRLTPATDDTQSGSGWASLFWEAFKRSRNAMALVDTTRRHVEVNGAYLQLVGYPRSAIIGRPIYELVAGGPLLSKAQWRDAIMLPRFTGVVDVVRSDDRRVTVQFAGHPEVVTGRRLVLAVALTTRERNRPVLDDSRTSALDVLSERERDVLRLISMGATGPEIAEELYVTHNTVRTHVRNAMNKLGARSRAQLVAMALAEGHALTQPQ